MADLSKHALISFEEGHRTPSLVDEIPSGGRVVLRTSSVSGQAIAARAGFGVALLPRFVGDGDPGLERLMTVKLEPTAHLWLLIHGTFGKPHGCARSSTS